MIYKKQIRSIKAYAKYKYDIAVIIFSAFVQNKSIAKPLFTTHFFLSMVV